MPTIESKKYGTISFVTVEAWNSFYKPRGKHKLIDDSDIKETVIPAPENIVDFTNPIEETIEPIEPTREELKAWLTDHEIEFNPRTSTDKLLEIYKKENNGSSE